MKKRHILFVVLSLSVIAVSQIAFGAEAPKDTLEKLRGEMDLLWTCIAAFLVFFMQAGFAMVEGGFTRAKNTGNIMMKNLMDFCFGSIAFWLIGAGIMFGANKTGWFGTIDFGLANFLGATPNTKSYANLIFQTVFAATAATIVSGAMAERTKFSAYLIYSIVVSAIIYPIFGSWAWNGLWGAEIAPKVASKGWLEAKGFIDFAGSTVVHSMGGWLSLAGVLVLGPRRGKFSNGTIKPIPGHSLSLAALGVFILWFGWFGFNPGSTTSVGGASFATIAVTTNLAGAAGAIAALLTAWILLKKPDIGMTLNGVLAGLVAIIAGCNNVSPWGATIIGFTAGIVVVFGVLLLDKLKIDDAVGAIPVHGMCGAWGTLLVGLLADPKYGDNKVGGLAQLWVQFQGVAAAFIFAMVAGLIMFVIIKYTIGLRVPEEEEAQGLDLVEHGAEAYADFRIAQR